MSATLLHLAGTCRHCGEPLTFLEEHEFAADDGTATCEGCVIEWQRAMIDYMRGNGPLPEQP